MGNLAEVLFGLQFLEVTHIVFIVRQYLTVILLGTE
jgi:hypothetical protein